MTIPASPIYIRRIRSRARDAVRRISERPTDVEFMTPTGTWLPAQTVRVEMDNRATLMQSSAGIGPKHIVVIFGVRGHESVPDTDMEEGYRMWMGDDEYQCVDVIEQLGEVQGNFEATG